MAFTSGLMADESGVPAPFGNDQVVYGWFKSADGSTGGDIDTGFTQVKMFMPVMHAAAVGNAIAVNEVVADVEVIMGGIVTIVTDANEVGRWMAVGN